MNIFSRSLGAKILGITFAVLILTFGALFTATFLMQRASTLHEVEVNAERIAEMLSMAIREPMAIGDNEGTTDKFVEVGRRYDDIDIHLTNFKGNVTYSTSDQFLRKEITDVVRSTELTAALEDCLRKECTSQSITEIDGKPAYLEIKSIPNEEACHHCHGSNQPVLGVMVMTQDISPQMNAMTSNQTKVGGIMAAGLAVLLGALSFFLRRAVLVPIHDVAEATEKISNGDLTVHVEARSRDQIGQLAQSVNSMTDHMRSMMQEIISGVGTLAVASGQLKSVSETVADLASDNQTRSDAVAAASEEMSTNMRSVAAATEQASVNISTVAAASEEMSATIDEISRNTAWRIFSVCDSEGNFAECTPITTRLSANCSFSRRNCATLCWQLIQP